MTSPKSRLPLQLTIITFGRLLFNTGVRVVYPFAPAFARGLGVPLADVYSLIALRNFAGFLSPLFSPLSARYGRRATMAGALLFFAIGCAVVFIWPAYWPFGLTLAVIALAKVIYDPAMQAYVGDNVPYAKRGRAISITELSWAGALLLGAPAVGLLIRTMGWQAPFVWLAVLAGITAVFLWRVLPQTKSRTDSRGSDLRDVWRVVRHNRVIWAAMLFTALIMASNELLFIVFGGWLEFNFGLSLLALGFSASLIGGAEVLGEVFSGWSVDRFGKRPVVMLTGSLNVAASLLLPFTDFNLPLALTAYFLLFLFFEITVVGSIPLLTEIVPSARTVVMSSVLAASALGRALGAWLGPALFSEVGFVGNGIAAAVLMTLAVLVLAYGIREGE
ncbi:MAG: MFS transporter [Chloroflexi bacterium]|nr:MFS transporter [Chloroflexota bacterium]